MFLKFNVVLKFHLSGNISTLVIPWWHLKQLFKELWCFARSATQYN